MAVFCTFKGSKRGMVLSEVIVALFFVSMAVALVAGLGQQVANFAKSSRQTAAIIEVRNRVNSFTRNTDDWMNKLRSSEETASIFTDCLPDSMVATADYSCPPNVDGLLAADDRLRELAGSQLQTVVDVPLVDNSGQRIAGTLAEPVYMTSDGGICEGETAQTSCPLKSVGYFMRSNSSTSANPGSVRFVVKVERNLSSPAAQSMAAMKAQYMTVDIGTDWMRSAKDCDANSLKLGYLSNGNPYCVSKMSDCAPGTVALGVQSDGKPLCATPSCSGSAKPVFDQQSNGLTCSDSSPCASGSVFLGYYGTNGEKICTSIANKCLPGTVQIGVEAGAGGSIVPVCKAVPTNCTASQIVVYDGDNGGSFICTNETAGVGCKSTEVLVGISRTGNALCEPRVSTPKDGEGGTTSGERSLASIDCGSGNYLQGMNWNEALQKFDPICAPMGTEDSDNVGVLGQYDPPPSWATGSNTAQTQKHIWPMTCSVLSSRKIYPCNYLSWGGSLEAGFRDGTDKLADPKSLIPARSDRNIYQNDDWYTHRSCMYINGQWRMYTGRNSTNTKNVYGRICTGGITYVKADPSIKLSGTYHGHPLQESSVSVGNILGLDRKPTKNEFMNLLSSCPATVTEVAASTSFSAEERLHCTNYINAKNKSLQEMNTVAVGGKEPSFCKIYHAPTSANMWTGCGSGCGVKFYYKYTLNSSNRVSSYIIHYRWAKNYVFAVDESGESLDVLPTGSTCNGSYTGPTSGIEAILALPPMPSSSDLNDI